MRLLFHRYMEMLVRSLAGDFYVTKDVTKADF
jgi:hypothetical protein